MPLPLLRLRFVSFWLFFKYLFWSQRIYAAEWQPVSQSNQAEHRTSSIGRAFWDGMMYDECPAATLTCKPLTCTCWPGQILKPFIIKESGRQVS